MSVESKKDEVALLAPCGDSIDTMVVQSMLLVVSFSSQHGYPVKFMGLTKKMLVHTARNTLAREFLKSSCEWSFWMDTDMVLEPRTIPVMLNHAKKLDAKALTGIYYQRTGEYRPLILKRIEGKKYADEYSADNIIIPDGLKHPFVVDACGFGCVALHRDVFKDMEEPYFKNIYLDEKHEVSEDFYFCKVLRDKKIDLWCIPELECGHIGAAPVIDKTYCKPKGEIHQIKFN